jgi:hypothetical protein
MREFEAPFTCGILNRLRQIPQIGISVKIVAADDGAILQIVLTR